MLIYNMQVRFLRRYMQDVTKRNVSMNAASFRSLSVKALALSLLLQQLAFLPQGLAKDASKNPPKAEAQNEAKADTSVPADFDELQSKAYLFVMDGKYAEAKSLLESALSKETDPAKITALHYLLAASERMSDDYGGAISHLKEVEKAEEAAKKYNHLQRTLLLRRLGDCYWGQRNAKLALSYYSAALIECANLPPNDRLQAALLEAITGTYVYDKNWVEAENFAKKNLQVTEARANASKSIEDYAAMFWARIQLLSIYRNENKIAERDKLHNDTKGMLDTLLRMRSELEKQGGIEQLEKMKAEFEQNYIKEYNPQTPAEYLWLASEYKMRSLPLISWESKTAPAKAAILCIHGLGLENRSFANFAYSMQDRGYTVYAMDVRGFGSWLTTQGQEDLQFSETIKDIGAMLTIIREREKSLPIFLLGESMGGAIALRGAAAYGDQIAGVISSVPSAELFQGRRMGMTVAVHLLKGKNKPFRVGDMVTEQATANEALSDKWKQDSKAKMEMSPKELIKFAVFMRSTKKECERIKTTPAFVVQGLKDRLVKPEGTVELFQAIPNDDKTLMIIGLAEHLIFETFTPSPFLLDALCTWLSDRSQPKQAEANTREAATK